MRNTPFLAVQDNYPSPGYQPINGLPTAETLGGTEPLAIMQGGVPKQTTVQDVANLAGGGGGSQSLSDVLSEGNTSGPNDIVFDASQGLQFNNNSRLREGTIDAGLTGGKGIAQICGAGYELKWEAGRLYVMGDGGVTIRWSMYNFTNVPSHTDDVTKGYQIGSKWMLDDGTTYVCIVDTESGAAWELESEFITVTKTELDLLISLSSLTQGKLYKITGVHTALYDDGTNSGTTIFLRALSTTQLEKVGTGIFYNPIYSSRAGFGIWTDLMQGNFSSIVGNFIIGEQVTANNGATGILKAQGLIQFIDGNWATATSIEGDTSKATANISGFSNPSITDGKSNWGGYVWYTVSENLGTSIDSFNLSSEWTKVVYNTTDYNIAFDPIEYDYLNDMIVKRTEVQTGNVVEFTKKDQDFFDSQFNILYNGIAAFMWGKEYEENTGKGIKNNKVINSYFHCVNFTGSAINDNHLSNSLVDNNIINDFINYNILNNAYIYDNILTNESSISNNILNNSSVNNNTLDDSSSINNNILNNSAIVGNQLGADSFLQTNELNNSVFNFSTSGQLTSKNISKIVANDVSGTFDIANATNIFGNYSKQMYKRLDGLIRLSYTNNTDHLVVVNVDHA